MIPAGSASGREDRGRPSRGGSGGGSRGGISLVSGFPDLCSPWTGTGGRPRLMARRPSYAGSVFIGPSWHAKPPPRCREGGCGRRWTRSGTESTQSGAPLPGNPQAGTTDTIFGALTMTLRGSLPPRRSWIAGRARALAWRSSAEMSGLTSSLPRTFPLT